MQLIPAEHFTRWHLPALPRPPIDFFKEDLRRLEAFDLKSSEQAKTLLIDALFAEAVPLHPRLKVWKAATISTDTLTGVADLVYGALPALYYGGALLGSDTRFEDGGLSPLSRDFGGVAPIADHQAGKIGLPQRRRLGYGGTNDAHVENVSLK
jgi:hypothetical protein